MGHPHGSGNYLIAHDRLLSTDDWSGRAQMGNRRGNRESLPSIPTLVDVSNAFMRQNSAKAW